MMKKTALTLTILILISAFFPTCSGRKRKFRVPDPMPYAIEMSYQCDYVENVPLLRGGEIPVYKEADALFNREYGYLQLGWDLTDTQNYSMNPGFTDHILGRFPESKLVERDDGMIILLFELDSGYRMYFLLTPELKYFCAVGTPFLVRESHSYKDFSRLRIGDKITEVEKIDGAAELFMRQIGWIRKELDNDPPNYHLGFNAFAERNAPFSTVHYLTDGILKIEYTMLDDDETVVISNIIYSKDRILPDSNGNPIVYTVCEDDLPY